MEDRLYVHGEIDVVSADHVTTQLLPHLRTGSASRVLDLSEVTLLSAAGARLVEDALRVAAANGVHLRVQAEPGCAAHVVLHLLGVL